MNNDHEEYERELSLLLKEKGIDRKIYEPFMRVSWEHGHSSGYHEVLLIDADLIDALHDSLKDTLK
jgi:hypothetical protein